MTLNKFIASIGPELGMSITLNNQITEYWSILSFKENKTFSWTMPRDDFVNIHTSTQFHASEMNANL